jgi:solute carrier family 35 (UDP-galactose transporter), member B1
MIFGYFFGRKTYTLRKVFLVLAVVSGIIMFMYKEEKQEKKNSENLLLGNVMMIFSLLTEGATSATEDRMRSEKKPTMLNLMFYVNIWSVAVGLIGIVTFNEAPRFLRFVMKHPEILKFIGLSMLVTTTGQFFRNSMVTIFGPLPLAIVSTIRKFISVFLSVILFGNSLTVRQWCAAAVVFGALFLDIILNRNKKNKTDKQPQEIAQNADGSGKVESDKKIEVFVIESSDRNNN